MKIIYALSIFLLVFSFTGCQKKNIEDIGTNQEQETIEERVTEAGNADKIEEKDSETGNEDKIEETNVQAAYIGKKEEQQDIDLDKYMIPEQSFDITLDDWGEVQFVSCKPTRDISQQEYASFFLVRDEQIVYRFPYLYEDNTMGHPGCFDNVGAVAFRDINGDGKDDIIVITYYFSGAGPTGMVPRPDIRIFLAGENEFYLAEDMIADATQHILEKDMTIDTVLSFLQ